MRYTTLIDISEYSSLYKNHNVRLVYLHMVLKSGWHDNDRDILDMSIRRIAYGTGLTISATRHALGILMRAQLVTKHGPVWNVKKWTIQETVTPRPKTARQKRQLEQSTEREKERVIRELEAARERSEILEALHQGKTQFMLYYEDLVMKAAAGDVDAQKAMERHRKTYEMHKKHMEEELKKQQS